LVLVSTIGMSQSAGWCCGLWVLPDRFLGPL